MLFSNPLIEVFFTDIWLAVVSHLHAQEVILERFGHPDGSEKWMMHLAASSSTISFKITSICLHSTLPTLLGRLLLFGCRRYPKQAGPPSVGTFGASSLFPQIPQRHAHLLRCR